MNKPADSTRSSRVSTSRLIAKLADDIADVDVIASPPSVSCVEGGSDFIRELVRRATICIDGKQVPAGTSG